MPPLGVPLLPDPRDRVPAPEMPVTGKPVQGRPAVVPTKPDAPLGQPTFKAEAAGAYALTDESWQATFPAQGPVTVASVEFLAGDRLGERGIHPGYQHVPDRVFCVVILAGSFGEAPPGNPAMAGARPQVTSIFLLFDARTGNYLGMGGLR